MKGSLPDNASGISVVVCSFIQSSTNQSYCNSSSRSIHLWLQNKLTRLADQSMTIHLRLDLDLLELDTFEPTINQHVTLESHLLCASYCVNEFTKT